MTRYSYTTYHTIQFKILMGDSIDNFKFNYSIIFFCNSYCLYVGMILFIKKILLIKTFPTPLHHNFLCTALQCWVALIAICPDGYYVKIQHGYPWLKIPMVQLSWNSILQFHDIIIILLNPNHLCCQIFRYLFILYTLLDGLFISSLMFAS